MTKNSLQVCCGADFIHAVQESLFTVQAKKLLYTSTEEQWFLKSRLFDQETENSMPNFNNM